MVGRAFPRRCNRRRSYSAISRRENQMQLSPQTTGTKITVEQTDLGRREGYSRCVWAAVLRTTLLCTIVTSFLEQVEIVLQHCSPNTS